MGYYDNTRLGEMLQRYNLKLTAGNIFENLHKPEEVAATIEWLCRNESGMVNGADLRIDGGFTISGGFTPAYS